MEDEPRGFAAPAREPEGPDRGLVMKSPASQPGLLRQPHGFERLGVIPEELRAEDPALAQRSDASQLNGRLRAVTCAAPHDPHCNSVADVNEVADQFQCVVVPGSTELLPLAHDRIPTYEGAGLGPPLRTPQNGCYDLATSVGCAAGPRARVTSVGALSIGGALSRGCCSYQRA